MTFQGHIMKKDSLENLTHTRYNEGKRSRGKQQVTYLMKLGEWWTVKSKTQKIYLPLGGMKKFQEQLKFKLTTL